jgi:hypothetical protein
MKYYRTIFFFFFLILLGLNAATPTQKIKTFSKVGLYSAFVDGSGSSNNTLNINVARGNVFRFIYSTLAYNIGPDQQDAANQFLTINTTNGKAPVIPISWYSNYGQNALNQNCIVIAGSNNITYSNNSTNPAIITFSITAIPNNSEIEY